MKITKTDFNAIQRAMAETLSANGFSSLAVDSTLKAWQVFHKANETGRLNLNVLYRDYSDNHIETALKKIFAL